MNSSDAGEPRPKGPRAARLVDGVSLLYADLHNHSLLSDGDGDPELAFASMRSAGLDVAALTDHASIPRHSLPGLDPASYPDDAALAVARTAPRSLDDDGWRRTEVLADAADVPGEFTAIRGFEWTEPWLGHACVWFSAAYVPVRTPGSISGLHEFLTEEPQALFGYNHPGREAGRFGGFVHDEALTPRMVSLEMFNRYDDYLFRGHDEGEVSPVQACLDAGWRPGLTGVSDEHGTDYGLAGKGRTGLWAREHSRAGVREALRARRCFATREPALVLDATLDGLPMGGAVPRRGPARRELVVDLRSLDGPGPQPVELQVLASGGPSASVPRVLATAPAPRGEVTRLEVDDDGVAWLLLRVADPSRANEWPGPDGHPGNAYALAYASPWYLGT